MAQLEVTINGRPYQVACADGEEQHLRNLADYVDRKVGELAKSMGQVGEARLMLMAGLVLADELADTMDKLEAAEAAAAAAAAKTLNSVARRIDEIAADLEKT